MRTILGAASIRAKNGQCLKSSNKSAPGDLVEMGSIGRPHGLMGEVGARWEGETPVPVGGKIWLQAEGEDPRPFEVEAARVHRGYPLISLAGIHDRDKAEALRGTRIFMPRSELPPPGEDEAWLGGFDRRGYPFGGRQAHWGSGSY